MSDTPRVLTDEERRWARTLWEYQRLRHALHPVDAAIGLGSHDTGVPAYCAELYHAGLFPALVFTGGVNRIAPERFPRGEAAHFRDRAVALGVPAEAILLEPDASNTGENIRFSRAVLAAAGITPASVLLVSMPGMERRAFATARRLWPEVDVLCAAAPVGFADYLAAMGGAKRVVDILVGDLQRVMEYPRRGFAVAQHVPEPVVAAFRALVAAGFDSCLIDGGRAGRP